MNQSITVYILAGGESRRFGENKALYLFKDKPMISHVIEQISSVSQNVVIIGKNEKLYEPFGYPVIEDLLPYQTPLAGIYTGLMNSNTYWNFFIACDMPFFSSENLLRLIEAIPKDKPDLEIIAPKTEQGIEPMAALYHKSLGPSIVENQKEIHSLKGFIRSRNHLLIDFKSSVPFRNINTKDQLDKLNP